MSDLDSESEGAHQGGDDHLDASQAISDADSNHSAVSMVSDVSIESEGSYRPPDVDEEEAAFTQDSCRLMEIKERIANATREAEILEQKNAEALVSLEDMQGQVAAAKRKRDLYVRQRNQKTKTNCKSDSTTENDADQLTLSQADPAQFTAHSARQKKLEEADRQQQHATTLAAKQRQAAPRSEDAAAMQAEFAVIEAKRNKIPTWPRVQAVAATAPAYVDTEEQARIQQARVSLRARLANKEISGGQFAAYIMMVKQGKPEPPVCAVVPAMAAAEDGTQSQGDGDDEGAAAHTLLVAEAASPSRAKQGARWRTALGDAAGGWGNWHGENGEEEKEEEEKKRTHSLSPPPPQRESSPVAKLISKVDLTSPEMCTTEEDSDSGDSGDSVNSKPLVPKKKRTAPPPAPPPPPPPPSPVLLPVQPGLAAVVVQVATAEPKAKTTAATAEEKLKATTAKSLGVWATSDLMQSYMKPVAPPLPTREELEDMERDRAQFFGEDEYGFAAFSPTQLEHMAAAQPEPGAPDPRAPDPDAPDPNAPNAPFDQDLNF